MDQFDYIELERKIRKLDNGMEEMVSNLSTLDDTIHRLADVLEQLLERIDTGEPEEVKVKISQVLQLRPKKTDCTDCGYNHVTQSELAQKAHQSLDQ